jgi:tetratricopeptide (TPR) repeat protein
MNRFEFFDLIGYVGLSKESPDGNYIIGFRDGHQEKGRLTLVKDKKILFEKKLERPNDCKVSNDGFVICCDWLDSMDLAGEFLVYNERGDEIIRYRTQANLGYCQISPDSKFAIVETYNSNNDDGNKIFIFDLLKGELLNKIAKPLAYNEALIDTGNMVIALTDFNKLIYKVDFHGNPVNFEDYYKKMISEGTPDAVIRFFNGHLAEQRHKDENYLKALLDESNSGKEYLKLDYIYREIGECYEAKGDIENTIFYWEKAVDINPKIGVKRKLSKLKYQ